MNDKFPKEYQLIYDQTKDHYSTEGYKIEWIDKIYLPFWICKQQIFIETQLKPDKLSEIFYQLIQNNIKRKSDICNFLGVKDDDFILNHLDFLLSNDYIDETVINQDDVEYNITHNGRNFFEENVNLDEIFIQETEFDFIVPELQNIAEEKYEIFYNDLNQEFFNSNKPIDINAKNSFSGYKPIDTFKLKIPSEKNDEYPANVIKHKNNPTLKKSNHQTSLSFSTKPTKKVIYSMTLMIQLLLKLINEAYNFTLYTILIMMTISKLKLGIVLKQLKNLMKTIQLKKINYQN